MKGFALTLIFLALPALAETPVASAGKVLTLDEARQISLKNHPRISVAQLNALAAAAVVREVGSARLPNVYASLGAVGTAEDNTRITTGGLTVSSVFNRASAGGAVSQLVTDFGRTSNLINGSESHARAENENLQATRAQLALEVEAAYFGALQAQAILRVALTTVTNRLFLRDQVRAMAANQLRSDLDVRFAEVAYQEAVLLRSRAENDVQAGFIALNSFMGVDGGGAWELREEEMPPAAPANVSYLVFQALRDRPELLRLRFERDSSRSFSKAEKALNYPTVSILGSAGLLPERDPGLNQHYAAAGVLVNIPFYSGGLYSARQDEAELRSQAAAAQVRDAENNVMREVRIAWLDAQKAQERLDVTDQLLEQARASYLLADTRYKVGSSSMVELSQAQLSLTSAEITHATARYDYLLRRAILNFQIGKKP